MHKKKRVVIKIGTKVITTSDRMLDVSRIEELARQISAIRRKGIEAIVVTSGAISAGMSLLGMKKRPLELSRLQATAAVGQSYLMSVYSRYFKKEGFCIGQILLTQEDFNDRKRYLNIKHTINALLEYEAVPVINENDTVATEEIKCGDNDRLSSLVADICQAESLVILTDVDGLLDENGKVIRSVDEMSGRILKLGGKSRCDLGTGGMATKLEAARVVTRAGITCMIAKGSEKNILLRILLEDEGVGTVFKTASSRPLAKKRWIAFSSRPKGAISVDGGAKEAVVSRDKSLLASGICAVKGDFSAGDVVAITGDDGKEFARGLVNYSSDEIMKIRGEKSSRLKSILGYKSHDEVVHKDNLAIL